MTNEERVRNLMSQKFKPWGYRVDGTTVYVKRGNSAYAKSILRSIGLGWFDVKCLENYRGS